MKRIKPGQEQIKNHVVFVMDESSSMQDIRWKAIEAINLQFDEVKKNANRTGQKTVVSFIKFGNTPTVVYERVDVNSLTNISGADYFPREMTALFDAFGEAVKVAEKYNNDEVANLVMIVTDGEENVSKRLNAEDVRRTIIKKAKEGNWTFTFQLPKGHKHDFSRKFSVDLDNIQEWENTEIGTQAMTEVQTKGIGNYFDARSQGHRSVDTFYTQTDLSKLKPVQLKKTLVDIKDRFKTFVVDKEQSIKEFVEKKMGKEYVIGSAFYELTKPELVQPTKDVLIMEKNKEEVWGGEEARELIGLPVGVKAKVEPLNHAKYQVFVSSTSVNRKLVRGTKVLVDKTMRVGKTPTWKA